MADSIAKKREMYITMPLNEKRSSYKCEDKFVTLDKVETWVAKFSKMEDSLKISDNALQGESDFGPFKANVSLNDKVSIWEGDITALEIDAIVNAANESLNGGGGVARAAMLAATRARRNGGSSFLAFAVASMDGRSSTLNSSNPVSTQISSTTRISNPVLSRRRAALENGIHQMDGAIHRAAGPELLAECKTLNGCPTGQAKISGGYKLPAKYIIHTVGPRGEKPDLLKSCYQNSLDILVKEGLRSIAFPCISTGVYGYPQENAAKVALTTVRKFLDQHSDSIDRVIFCLFLKEDIEIYSRLMQIAFPTN